MVGGVLTNRKWNRLNNLSYLPSLSILETLSDSCSHEQALEQALHGRYTFRTQAA